MTDHDITLMPSQAGWVAACSCGWRAEAWRRAKNSAGSDGRGHKRAESVANGARARQAHRTRQEMRHA